MIYSPLSSPGRTREFPLAAGQVPAADGQAFVNSITAGLQGVLPSAGTANEKFVGFVNSQTSAVSFLQTTAVAVETFVIPAGKTVTLGRAPVAGTTFVKDMTAGAAVTSDSVTGKVVTLTTNGVAGNTILVTYRYNLTVAEARSRNGDVTPGGYAGLTTGSVALMQSGTIYTDQFNSSLDWSVANETVVLGANGILQTLTANAVGTKVSGVIVALPSVEYPFLGIDFDAY